MDDFGVELLKYVDFIFKGEVSHESKEIIVLVGGIVSVLILVSIMLLSWMVFAKVSL